MPPHHPVPCEKGFCPPFSRQQVCYCPDLMVSFYGHSPQAGLSRAFLSQPSVCSQCACKFKVSFQTVLTINTVIQSCSCMHRNVSVSLLIAVCMLVVYFSRTTRLSGFLRSRTLFSCNCLWKDYILSVCLLPACMRVYLRARVCVWHWLCVCACVRAQTLTVCVCMCACARARMCATVTVCVWYSQCAF